MLITMFVAPVPPPDCAFVVPSTLVLFLPGIPPIMTNTYAGIRAVDAAAVDAAVGMGYRPLRVLFSVQVPCALPLIISGFRGATLQVISTATIAAYVSLGGLGRLIIDGRAKNDYDKMLVGALLVAILALVVDLLLAVASRVFVSPGLDRRTSRIPLRVRRAAAPVS